MRDGHRFARSIDQLPSNQAPLGACGPRLVGIRKQLVEILARAGRPLTIREIAVELFKINEDARRRYRDFPYRIRHFFSSIDVETLAGGLIRLKAKQ